MKLIVCTKSAAGAAAGVVDAAFVGREHLDKAAHDAGRGVELAAVLALGAGEAGEEILIHAAEDVFRLDRGRDGALSCPAPPSEPDGRISRIRLSSQQVAPLRRLALSLARASFQAEEPVLGKVAVGPAVMVEPRPRPRPPRRLRRMARSAPRTHPSISRSAAELACLK